MQGIGHLSPDQSRIPGVSGIPPPKASEPSIHDFFESLSAAQDREAQVRAIQQFTAELLSAPPKSGPPALQGNPDTSRLPSEGAAGRRITSPQLPGPAVPAVSRESSPGRREELMEEAAGNTPAPLPFERTKATRPAVPPVSRESSPGRREE